MKRFNVTVNGRPYDVAVEEVTGNSPAPSVVSSPAPVAQAPAVSPAPAAEKAEPAAELKAGEGTKVSAPMPGTILEIKISVGDTVKTGQPIFVLESMKMENDIVSPCDGKVTGIVVRKGDQVNSSDPLATIQE